MIRLFLVGTLVLLLFFSFSTQPNSSGATRPVPSHHFGLLIEEAHRSFSEILSTRTHSFASTVEAYTHRRRRAPPPGFDEWYQLAVQHDAVIVESFWDAIYEDLDVFVKYSPQQLSALASAVATTPSPLVQGFFIENGSVRSTCEPANLPCLQVQAMLGRIAEKLPPLILPFNSHASPRVLADVATPVDGSQDPLHWLHDDSPLLFTSPHDRPAAMQRACDGNTTLAMYAGNQSPRGSFDNVRALSSSKQVTARDSLLMNDAHHHHHHHYPWDDVCWQPYLLHMHGALIRPNCLNITTRLLPLFSPAKIAGIETAIRYPDSIYWSREPGYYPAENVRVPWKAKFNTAFWRGANTGGGHGAENWQDFHRHRFVALTNATYLKSVKEGRQRGWAEKNHLDVPISDRMIRLNQKYIDTGFSTIRCRDDSFRNTNGPCSYLDAHFHVLPWQPLDKVLSSYRYLFDIDGNSYSGRFHSLLLSESVVFKATIFREWHDSRLFPWLHFVPISNHFGEDLWDVLEFFVTTEHRAHEMAVSCRKWALQVLRPIDMELYLLRLLLEWNRLIRPRDDSQQ